MRKIKKKMQLRKFEKLAIWKILKIANLKRSENIPLRKIRKLSICKIRKTGKFFTLENSKNVQFGKFEKFSICKMSTNFFLYQIPKRILFNSEKRDRYFRIHIDKFFRFSR